MRSKLDLTVKIKKNSFKIAKMRLFFRFEVHCTITRESMSDFDDSFCKLLTTLFSVHIKEKKERFFKNLNIQKRLKKRKTGNSAKFRRASPKQTSDS